MVKIPLDKIILQNKMEKHITQDISNFKREYGPIGELQQYKFDRLNKEGGKIIPPIVLQEFYGFYSIIDGRHRVVKAINNCDKYINANIIPN